ncbi:MAG TPA: class I SAM-dependent methyltransferase [Armatimonadota bacterium]|jgi:SAM-dependent methyltransferase
MQSQFTDLAPLYDSLMAEIPYEHWVDYVLKLAALEHHTVHRVLDVGCGTGSAAYLLADRGCEVVGFDASPQMIEVARRKAGGRRNPSFFVSRMEELNSSSTPSPFDTAISLFDTVNYVTDPTDLQRAFKAVFTVLEPGGLFIFDMNTPFALEMEMFTQNNLKSRGEPKYSWISKYNPLERLTTVDMSFYVKQGDTRVTVKETHFQRAYAVSEIHKMLAIAGLDVLDTFEAFTLKKPRASTDRAHIVARRPRI